MARRAMALKIFPPGGYLLAACLTLIGACDSEKPTQPKGTPDAVVPDFRLVDVNPNSATHGDSISPRDFLGQISGWYFGHST